MPPASTALRYQSLLDGTLDAVIVVDARGRCVAANLAAASLLGYQGDELLQRELADLIERGHPWTKVEPACFLVEGQWQGEILVRRKDGVLLAVEAWSAGLSHPAGDAWILFLRNPASRPPGEVNGNSALTADLVVGAATAVTTLDGIITEWSPPAEQLYGYAAAEVTGHALGTLAPPGLASEAAAWLRQVRCGKRVTSRPTTHVTKNGGRIDVSVALSPMRDASGVVAAAEVIICPLAEKPFVTAGIADLAEVERLQASDTRFREAFAAASIGMALVSSDGRFLVVNPALCDIVGYAPAELLQKTFPDITHPEDLTADLVQERQLLAGEISAYQIERRYLRKGGQVIWGRLTVSLVRDPQGTPLYLVTQVQDITPFKAAGAALREAEARYRTLVEHIPAAVYVDPADALGSPLYVSSRVADLLGYAPDEWLATRDLWVQRLHPDDRGRVLKEIATANETGKAFHLEYRFLARDGRVVWVHDQASLVRDEEGRGQYWQGFMVDITDRKLAEEELRTAKEAAEEASRLKSAFLSMATHELRTPLTIISGYVELLAESAARLTPEEREFLDLTQTSTKALGGLVDNLLDLARIEAGRLELVIRAVDVGGTIARVYRMVAGQAAAKGIELAVEVAPGLPPAAADPDRLFQVLLNLVSNAVKFTERGHVRTIVRSTGGGVEIAVADTGIGIAPAAVSSIFDEFRQADAGTTRKFGGSGLGLAIAKRLVEMHDGSIAVTSELGAGSTFTVWLPAASTDAKDERELQSGWGASDGLPLRV